MVSLIIHIVFNISELIQQGAANIHIALVDSRCAVLLVFAYFPV